MKRSPITTAIRFAAIAALGAVLSLVRWLWQGTSNVYTKLDLHVYVADPDLGWRRTDDGYVWLGLDALAISVSTAIGIFLIIWLIGRRGEGVPKILRVLPTAAKIVAPFTLVFPLFTFVKGAPPSGAREVMPSIVVEAPTDGITASLKGAPAGRYEVVAHADAAIRATLEAGGEAFEARFAGGLSGFLDADPSKLVASVTAEVSVRTDSIDTGIALRNEHALEDLEPKKHPTIGFALTKLTSTAEAEQGISFAAEGHALLGGRKHEAPIVGTLRLVDSTLQSKLGLDSGTYLLVQASLSLHLPETIVGNDGTFDKDDVPIAVTLILKHKEKHQ